MVHYTKNMTGKHQSLSKELFFSFECVREGGIYMTTCPTNMRFYARENAVPNEPCQKYDETYGAK